MTKKVKLHTWGQGTMDSGATDTVGIVLELNNPHNGFQSQPFMWDQWVAAYQEYRVTGAKVYVTMRNKEDTTAQRHCYYFMGPSQTDPFNGNDFTTDIYRGLIFSKVNQARIFRVDGPGVANPATKPTSRDKRYINIRKYMNQEQWVASWSATTASPSTNVIDYVLRIGAEDFATTAQTAHYEYRVTLYCEFRSPKQPVVS